MPGRNGNSGDYRYGFNGMESDDEVKGIKNSYDFGARIYDPRVGRWLSGDPLEAKYPALSTYIFSNNNPVIYKDIDGQDWIITITEDKAGNKTINIKLKTAIINYSNDDKITNAVMMKLNQKLIDNVIQTYSIAPQIHTEQTFANIPSLGDREYLKKLIPVTNTYKVTVNVEVESRVISSVDQLKSDEHLMAVLDEYVWNDEGIGLWPGDNAPYGDTKLGGKLVRLNATKVDGIVSGKDDNTIPHEYGNTYGLEHFEVENIKDKNNAMVDGGSDYMSNTKSVDMNATQVGGGATQYQSGELNKPIDLKKVKKYEKDYKEREGLKTLGNFLMQAAKTIGGMFDGKK